MVVMAILFYILGIRISIIYDIQHL